MSRLTSIGASDSPKVVLGPQFPVWAEKTGLAEPPDLDEVEAVQWGNILERVIAETYAKRTGRTVEHNAKADVTRHPTYLFMTATLDAIQTDDERGIGCLEIKNAGQYMASEWEDEPPLRFQIQLQHQLAVTGLSWGTLCVLLGGNKMRHFDMQVNPTFIDAMIAKEKAFWQMVVNKTPPPPDGSIATRDTLRRLYPHGNDGEIIALPDEADAWDKDLQQSKGRIKFWEKQRNLSENQLRAAMGAATTGVLPGGGKYTLKTTKRKGYSVEPTLFRVLRRSKG